MVHVPASLSQAEEREWVERMVARLTKREEARRLNAGRSLEAAARRLNARHFGGVLRWASIGYVPNQSSLLGSCTPQDRTIRISHRIARLPDWVRDYVVMHELAHLLEPGHDERFWALVSRYPLAERARGYLMALEAPPPEPWGSVP